MTAETHEQQRPPSARGASGQPRRERAYNGLTGAEAETRLAQYGPNALREARETPWWRILLRQFADVLIVLLMIAAAIAIAVGETIDAVAIGLIVALNGVLGFVQEWQAERSLAALRRLLAERATVVRDRVEQRIDTRLLVPGDLVLLEAGDRVPADMRLLRVQELRIDESVLTGESVSVGKVEAERCGEEDARRGLAFMGTSAVAGRGEGVVTQTGMATEFGRIAELTGSVEEGQTHLQEKLGRLGRYLGLAAVLIGLAIVVIGSLTGRQLVEMFMTGISLAVAMVPEGLPAVVTITLALGASAMVRRKALSRRLQATETLGAASVICTDKTGTLTENQMTAARVWLPSGFVEVTGSGYDPAGHFESGGERVDHSASPELRRLLETGLICNNAALNRVGSRWQMTGDPTEGALVTLAFKGWIELPRSLRVTHEIPFSSASRRMTMFAELDGSTIAHAKGAPEAILERCSQVQHGDEVAALEADERDAIHAAYEAMAGDGMRVLALARREVGKEDGEAAAETDLVFLGLVGIIDPPRAEVLDAVRLARSAGIRIVMITGDGASTALAIAKRLGMEAARAITGAMMEEVPDAEVRQAIEDGAVFARVAPADKMRIVELLQADGAVVAMTGDGVNDAPALKLADIGIAMGVRGTDVAKDASDMVLLDDNFASIVGAVEEGRRQYDNIKKFVRYLLASNTGEVAAIFVNIVIGGPLIFLAIQILWINLVTDSLSALTLGLERSDEDTMRRPPRDPDENIVDRNGLVAIVLFGLYTSAASLFVFYDTLGEGLAVAQTAAFTAMVLFEQASVFAFRSLSLPLSRIGFFSNPWLLAAVALMIALQVAAVYWPPLQHMLRTTGLEPAHWQLLLALALPLVAVPELAKLAIYFRKKKITRLAA